MRGRGVASSPKRAAVGYGVRVRDNAGPRLVFARCSSASQLGKAVMETEAPCCSACASGAVAIVQNVDCRCAGGKGRRPKPCAWSGARVAGSAWARPLERRSRCSLPPPLAPRRQREPPPQRPPALPPLLLPPRSSPHQLQGRTSKAGPRR
eukprot:scaffold260_cov328-Prasinococcus_capsulatus_cf.AAC.2